ncbi:Leucine zipper transcription factor-like protein 1 [Phlyctochytrium bullatum]|nr:Leucine zipper transcription factor-like protein 1 [Phlyctochytrium bullatum]
MPFKLTSHHKNEVIDYLKFVRAQKSQTVREVKCTIEEIADKFLSDTTYTRRDVKDIIDEIEADIVSAVEVELMHHAHRHMLLLQQYFAQVEVKGMELQGNFSSLDDR